MTMNEYLRRTISNILISMASAAFGGIWFSLSVLAYVIEIFLPPAPEEHSVPSPPRHSNGTSARPPARLAPAPLPSILFSKKDTPNQHVRFPNLVVEPGLRPRATKRWSSPAGLSVALPSEPHEEIQQTLDVLKPESQSDLSGARVTPPLSISRLPPLASSSHLESASPASSPMSSLNENEDEAEPTSLSRTSSMPMTRKASLTCRLPAMNVFRNRSRRAKSEGGHSRSNSLSSSVASTPPSTPPMTVLELRADPERGSTSTVSSAEPPSRGFAQTFKFRPKRSSASATMSAAADRSSSLALHEAIVAFHQTPSPPPSPEREHGLSSATRSRSQSRRKAFTSYLNLSVLESHHRSATSSGSHAVTPLESDIPSSSHRSLFSPATPKSLCPKRQQPKAPSGPVARTQPYGYPYFAMMPNGEYAELPPELRLQRSSGGSASHSRSSSIDSLEGKVVIEQAETPSTALPANTLGLELAQLDTPRTSRHRQVATTS